MSTANGLDLSGLAQFRASDLLVGDESSPATGKPMQVGLSLIDLDPAQPRRSIDEATIAELADSIRAHGVLEPVSLRTHPSLTGRFVVNRGERRVRAAHQAGLVQIPAFLDERVDPYAQAVENLHRENMSPFDLATFISEREREGHTRAEIGRRLNKSRSFITQAASLIGAPDGIRMAFETGRLGSDARTLYQLALAMKKRPDQAASILSGGAVITRATLEAVLLEDGRDAKPGRALGVASSEKPLSMASAGRTVLIVEHAGRRGSLRLKARDDDTAEIRFGDGSCDTVSLKELRLVCWATEE